MYMPFSKKACFGLPKPCLRLNRRPQAVFSFFEKPTCLKKCHLTIFIISCQYQSMCVALPSDVVGGGAIASTCGGCIMLPLLFPSWAEQLLFPSWMAHCIAIDNARSRVERLLETIHVEKLLEYIRGAMGRRKATRVTTMQQIYANIQQHIHLYTLCHVYAHI